jgi:hypothetical protein
MLAVLTGGDGDKNINFNVNVRFLEVLFQRLPLNKFRTEHVVAAVFYALIIIFSVIYSYISKSCPLSLVPVVIYFGLFLIVFFVGLEIFRR